MSSIKDLNQRLSVLEKGSESKIQNLTVGMGKGSASTTTTTTVLSTPSTPPTPAAKPVAQSSQPSTKVNFIDDYNKQKEKQDQDVADKVNEVGKKQAEIRGVDLKNVMKVVAFVVDFAEDIGSYVPEVLQLVGGHLTGQVKLAVALQLAAHLIGDVTSALRNIGLKDMINHTVDVKNSNKVNSDGSVTTTTSQTTTDTTDVKKDMAKKTSRLGFGIRRNKKGTSA